MRVTTAFKRLLRLDGVNVTAVEFLPAVVLVTVALRSRRLTCGHCGHAASTRYDTRPVESRWRHLDLGVWRVELRASLRRLRCPTHGVVVEGVPFARPRAKLTRDFDDLLAWLAMKMDKTAIARLTRVSWRTVGRACERVVASELDPGRLDGLFRIGVDEISWRKHHKYLTLVVDHDRGRVIWGAKGRDAKTLDQFFDELGDARSALIEAVSLDLGPAFLKSVKAEGHAPQAVVCADPFHLVKLVGDALDEVRRDLWQELRRLPGDRWAKDFKGARWALLKNPEDLTGTQAAQLAKLKRSRGGIWRAYEMKELPGAPSRMSPKVLQSSRTPPASLNSARTKASPIPSGEPTRRSTKCAPVEPPRLPDPRRRRPSPQASRRDNRRPARSPGRAPCTLGVRTLVRGGLSRHVAPDPGSASLARVGKRSRCGTSLPPSIRR